MVEKMSLIKFKEIKEQLALIISRFNEICLQHKNDDDFDVEIEEKKCIEQYFEIQNNLLSYDLSMIPYEEWEDLEILCDEKHIADFSKTNANIDFTLVEYFPYANYKSCKIKNITGLEKILNSEHFDLEVIGNNTELFLSESFPDEIKKKIYDQKLTIEDLTLLSNTQIAELQSKNYRRSMDIYTNFLIDNVGLEKTMHLYNISNDDYKVIYDLLKIFFTGTGFHISDAFFQHDFEEELKNVDVSQVKDVFYSCMRKIIFQKSHVVIKIKDLPELFVKENSDILLLDENIPEDLRQKYYNRQLNFDDIIDNISLFKNIPVSNFTSDYDIEKLAEVFGENNLSLCIAIYPEVFNYIVKSQLISYFCDYASAVEKIDFDQMGVSKQRLVDYFKPFFDVNNKLGSGRTKQLMAYDTTLFSLDDDQQRIVDAFNLNNIKRFEKETGFFSKNDTTNLQMFEALSSFLRMYDDKKLFKVGIDFKGGTLSYEDFLNELAKLLDYMRKNNLFTDYPDYDYVTGSFRESHPEIFVDMNAPEELKECFYRNKITPEFLAKNKEYIKYLVDKNLFNTLKVEIKLAVPCFYDENGNVITTSIDFINEYVSRYGNEKLLQLIAKYGGILSNIEVLNLNHEIDDEYTIEKSLRIAIYNKIVKGTMDYSYLLNVPEFVSEYPELFVDFTSLTNVSEEEIKRLENAYYSRKLSFADIKQYPELVTLLKDKNIGIVFGNVNSNSENNSKFGENQKQNDLVLLNVLGNEKFLELCSIYGRYIEGIGSKVYAELELENKFCDFKDISKSIEGMIVEEIFAGNLPYYPSDAPTFLIVNYPELFLDPDVPEDLNKYFYNYNNSSPMSFEVLQQHKEWLPYLKDKSLTTSLLRNKYLKKELIIYLTLFGEEKGIKLGISKAETVKEMMRSNQVELMKSWFDKTGGKFIPDFVVMQNFSLEEADKFLASGSNWSALMKNKNFANTSEARDAVLKLAYSFGAFDHDQRGMKKLQDLLTNLPKQISAENQYILEDIDKKISIYSQKEVFYGVKTKITCDDDGTVHRIVIPSSDVNLDEAYQKMIEYVKQHSFSERYLDNTTLLNLLEILKKENVNIDFSKDIFTQIYRKNYDGSYTLTINPQSCPKSSEIIRGILEKFVDLPILSATKAHQLFGGFCLKYDADFREFLLSNLDLILTDSNYTRFIASIQRQFTDIRVLNSNRILTLDLAVSYVQANKYASINVGNEGVAEISSIAGYSQSDFNVLQQIYNYGKQRTFSSIPRIIHEAEKVSGRYTYEILKLHDPLAMAIGTLTDCCQELNNCAEVCMEHSMVDKNGRIFVIRDQLGNIIAQSWVWRNKDVLCFDNIEIPRKAFERIAKEYPDLGTKGFASEVYDMYKQAAHDLIEADEKVYKELLESGKITQEQYDGLRLGKVTVGLGYNDIAESIKKNSQPDKGEVSIPLPFEEPVRLSRGLYTNDSVTQYILEEREDRKDYYGETLAVHNDTFVEYTDSNFTQKMLFSLEKLEIVTKGDVMHLETAISEYVDSGRIVTEIAQNYGLNPQTTRIIINPNFAIIYDVNGDKVTVGDLLFNTRIDNEQQQLDIEDRVVIQMKLAFDQIASDKEIVVSNLSEKQMVMYSKIVGLTDELDVERGVGHAK